MDDKLVEKVANAINWKFNELGFSALKKYESESLAKAVIQASGVMEIQKKLDECRTAFAITSNKREAYKEAHSVLLEQRDQMWEALKFYANSFDGHAGDSGPGGNWPADPDSWPSDDLLDDGGGWARRVLSNQDT